MSEPLPEPPNGSQGFSAWRPEHERPGPFDLPADVDAPGIEASDLRWSAKPGGRERAAMHAAFRADERFRDKPEQRRELEGLIQFLPKLIGDWRLDSQVTMVGFLRNQSWFCDILAKDIASRQGLTSLRVSDDYRDEVYGSFNLEGEAWAPSESVEYDPEEWNPNNVAGVLHSFADALRMHADAIEEDPSLLEPAGPEAQLLEGMTYRGLLQINPGIFVPRFLE